MSEMTKHTSGPWVAVANPGREPVTHYVTTGDGQFCIADLPSGSTCTAANAALIAAAPDMLAALRELAAIGEGGVIERRETGKPTWYALDAVKSIARAAIAKAEGNG